ncbi:MAG TPA: hypothetical protein VFX47_02925 [Gammaproteobacteria bacterium]|nr:hypothetical protein [Gammaproteobacteria bacterium]
MNPVDIDTTAIEGEFERIAAAAEPEAVGDQTDTATPDNGQEQVTKINHWETPIAMSVALLNAKLVPAWDVPEEKLSAFAAALSGWLHQRWPELPLQIGDFWAVVFTGGDVLASGLKKGGGFKPRYPSQTIEGEASQVKASSEKAAGPFTTGGESQ